MQLQYIKELYYKLTGQRYIPINNIFFGRNKIHYDKHWETFCLVNHRSITYLNEEQNNIIRKMLEEDKINGNGHLEKIVRAEDIIRRCCVCKKTEKLPTNAQVYFSDGYLSRKCLERYIKPSEVDEIVKELTQSKLYDNCDKLHGPFYGADEKSLSK